MSKIDNDAVIPLVIEDENVEKQSLVKKLTAPIKKHPRLATAIGLGVVLVGGAAVLGSKDDNSVPDLTPELEPAPVDTDTPVTDEN